jgi:cell division protease FtsH
MKEDNPGKSYDGLKISLLVLVIGVSIFLFIQYTNQNIQPQTISYTQFQEQLEEGHVSKVVFNGQQIDGTFDPPLEFETAPGETTKTGTFPSYFPFISGQENETAAGESTKIESFRTYLPPIPDNRLLDLLGQRGVTIETQAENNSSRWMTLLNWVPILIIVLFVFQFIRRMPAGQGEGITSMLQSRAKPYDKDQQKVTFQDVAGLTNVKQELREVIEFLQNPEKFQRFGATVPKGVLLVGPPGTGKTLLARAVAGEAEAAFFPISGSDFMELFVGVGASRVRNLFKQAKEKAPAIIFIDELDSIGRRRGIPAVTTSVATLNQMLAGWMASRNMRTLS